MNAFYVVIAIYVVVIGVIIVGRLTSKTKWTAEEYWSVFIGLMVCSIPILLGMFFFGYLGVVIGLFVSVWIVRQIVRSSRKPR